MSIFNLGRSTPTEAGAAGWWRGGDRRAPTLASPATAPQEFAAAPGVVAAPWWRRSVLGPVAVQDRQDAYDKGVRDEARVARRRRHPILALAAVLTILVLATAAGGVAFVVLAFNTGSFASAGAAVDGQIGAWRSGLVGGAAKAAAQGGDALTSAGQSIKTRAQQAAQTGG